MYYIKKYVNCWAIHDDDTGDSRPLTEMEIAFCTAAIPELSDRTVLTYFLDRLPEPLIDKSLAPSPPGWFRNQFVKKSFIPSDNQQSSLAGKHHLIPSISQAMTNAELLQIKISGRSPQFKELIELKPAEATQADILLDFCRFVHPGADITAEGSNVSVFTRKGHYIYSLYTAAILKTNVNTGSKTLYKLSTVLKPGGPSLTAQKKRNI